MMKSKLKKLLSEFKSPDNMRKGREILRSSAKLIPSDSDIDEVFKSMHQSVMTE